MLGEIMDDAKTILECPSIYQGHILVWGIRYDVSTN